MNNRKLGLGAIMMIALVSTIIGIGVTPILLQLQQSAFAWIEPDTDPVRKAPIATDGNNIYIVWFNDKTPGKDGEVMFRLSTDGGPLPKLAANGTIGSSGG